MNPNLETILKGKIMTRATIKLIVVAIIIIFFAMTIGCERGMPSPCDRPTKTLRC